MRIFLPLSAPKWPTHRAFKVIKGTRCKSPINLIFFSTISSEERERIFMKFLKRNLSILCSGVAEWPRLCYSFSIVLKERTWRRRRVEKIRWKTYLLLNMMYSGQIYGFIFKAKLSKTVFYEAFWD